MTECSRLFRPLGVAAATAVAVAALLPATAAVAHEVSPAATTAAPQLASGASLAKGKAVASQGAGFTLVLQQDGNLVEYLTTAGRAVWATGTTCAGDERFTMQTDGNAVLYCGSTALFATGSTNQAYPAPPNVFVIGVNGEMAVGSSTGAAGPAWTSPAPFPTGNVVFAEVDSDNGLYHFVMQADGNLVLYSSQGTIHALWSSGTAGNRGSYVILQIDGNLVVYSPSRATWSSGSAAPNGQQYSYLAVQDDGNVVLYQGNEADPGSRPTVLWSTGTAGRR